MALYLTALAAAAAAAAAPAANPFAGQTFYVNPAFVAEISSSIATCSDPTACANLRLMRGVASAFWVDTKAKIAGDANHSVSVAGILADAASKQPPQAVVLIVYDLPNRDCHAKASNGEICCTYNADGTCDYDASGDCAAGIAAYQSDYIDPLAALLGQYEGKVPVIAVIEPDSLPNLASNMADNHCGNSATVSAYKTGIPYASACGRPPPPPQAPPLLLLP
jgi:cellulose 1,4-beta-cellobiosidase